MSDYSSSPVFPIEKRNYEDGLESVDVGTNNGRNKTIPIKTRESTAYKVLLTLKNTSGSTSEGFMYWVSDKTTSSFTFQVRKISVSMGVATITATTGFGYEMHYEVFD